MSLRATIVDEASKFIAMIPVRAVKAAGWLLAWPLSAMAGSEDHRAVFVIAVPRSGSTLLYNLIAWNGAAEREIIGYGENCASYRSKRDLARMRVRARFYLRRWSPPTYVADKLVLSAFTVDEAVLVDERCFFIFLTRNKSDALASFENKFRMSRADAEAFHEARAAELAAMHATARNKIDVSYEELLAQPRVVLDRVGSFLGLEKALSEGYEVPPNVGNFSYGDNGELIRSGRIVAEPTPEA